MRIAHGDTSRKLPFFAANVDDLTSAVTGLSGFTVYFSVDGGSVTQLSSPTVTELSSSNMPGIYALAVNNSSMVTLPSGATEAVVIVRISHSSMAPVMLTYVLIALDLPGAVNDSSPTATEFATNLSSTTDAYYTGTYCKFISGSLKDQVRKVTGYVGSTKKLQFSTGFTSAPANGDRFLLVNQ